MFLKDVKIGGRYCRRAWDDDTFVITEVIADSIERDPNGRGSCVMATEVGSGKKVSCHYRSLTPWDEHIKQEQEEELYVHRMTAGIEAMAEEIGYESEGRMDYWGSATLCLSEEAVERVLGLCAAKPIPENRRPSTAPDSYEWSRCCDLLSLRVRRAIGCGRIGYETPNYLHQASITFRGERELQQAMDKLGVGEDTTSRLGELLV